MLLGRKHSGTGGSVWGGGGVRGPINDRGEEELAMPPFKAGLSNPPFDSRE